MDNSVLEFLKDFRGFNEEGPITRKRGKKFAVRPVQQMRLPSPQTTSAPEEAKEVSHIIDEDVENVVGILEPNSSHLQPTSSGRNNENSEMMTFVHCASVCILGTEVLIGCVASLVINGFVVFVMNRLKTHIMNVKPVRMMTK